MLSIGSLLIAIPIFLIGIFMHELAHLYVARLFHVKSRLGFYGVCPAVLYSNKELQDLSIKKIFWITMSPMPVSFIYLFLFMIVINYENYLHDMSLYAWILSSIGFAVGATLIASMHDLKLYHRFDKRRMKNDNKAMAD